MSFNKHQLKRVKNLYYQKVHYIVKAKEVFKTYMQLVNSQRLQSIEIHKIQKHFKLEIHGEAF